MTDAFPPAGPVRDGEESEGPEASVAEPRPPGNPTRPTLPETHAPSETEPGPARPQGPEGAPAPPGGPRPAPARPGAAASPFDAAALLARLGERQAERFKRGQYVKSFKEFLDDLFTDPVRQTRDAARYLLDMFRFFGRRDVRSGARREVRWNVFDSPATGGKGRVFGQERVQNDVVKFVRTFAEKGKVDKLLMLHGPNGSAKSTTVECIMRGLELYSREAEGTLYRFNWIFSESFERDRIGFTAPTHVGPKPDNYADLGPEEVSSRIACELRDNPVFLIPREERGDVLRDAFARQGLAPERIPPLALEGDLCQKCREVFDTLLSSYKGDWTKVVAHVQVERFFISKRYRTGAVVIEPQRNVDAVSRPINMEMGYRVPPILQNANLHEPLGDLVDANRGVVEYSDFFKRPLETNKYLLTTIEKNTVNLGASIAYLDLIMAASTDEKNLNLFKRDPDFGSFKGRFELIKVPYLLEFSKEARMYQEHVVGLAKDKHVAPHTGRVVAIWAVLTRLRRPRTKNYPGTLGNLVGRLTPIEKAYLYDQGRPPEDMTDAEKKELAASVDRIRNEFEDHEEEFEGLLDAAYEGRRGASPREMQTLLAEAAASPDFRCLSPLAVLKALRELVRNVSVYDFLRLTPQSGYNDNARFIDDAETEYRKAVEEEVQEALDLVSEREYRRLFEDYFQHVRAFVRGEKVRNRQTGDLEDPDEELMAGVEKLVEIKENAEQFRKNLVTRIGAFSIENPGSKIDYMRLFGDIFRALRGDFHKRREKQILTLLQDILRFGTDEFRNVDVAQRRVVKRSIARLKVRYGYCLHCAKEVVAYVLKHHK